MDLLNQALKLREQKEYEESRQLFLLLAQKQPDDARIMYQTAWSHDVMGKEKEAVPYYEKAIELGLEREELLGAYVGLGSTYRCLGEYHKAIAVLEAGCEKFPEARELQVFLAMAYYNVQQSKQAISMLLKIIADTSTDKQILAYEKAIRFYADHLDETWSD